MASEGMIWFVKTVADVAIYVSFIPLLFILFIKSRTYFKIKWVLFVLIALGVSIDLMLKNPDIDINYNVFYNAYTVICIVTSMLLFNYILTTLTPKKISFYTLLTLLVIFLACILYTKNPFIDSSLPYLAYSLIIVLLAFLFFRTLLNQMKIQNLLIHPPFWIVFAFLIYYGGTMSLTLFQDFILGQAGFELTVVLWPIQSIASILFSILISISLWTMRKT